ncbi:MULTISPECIES: hypothetical protein [Buttiauxella]|jgi:hypothetical protein|uniref:hypothetical protein n=2 Tax=Bacteria TaxID=2 RepID=UPI00106653A8|nr:hypothetical protein [Buttiauxella sp. BIGb0552]TDX11947.1 hypothetical protein EDF88_4545 [Buttiauxella sp. BIGb0552]
MIITLEKFIHIAHQRRDTAQIRLIDDAGEPDRLLWLTAEEVEDYVAMFGPHHGLLAAARHYGMNPADLVTAHRIAGRCDFYASMPVVRNPEGLWQHPEHPATLNPAELHSWLKVIGYEYRETRLDTEPQNASLLYCWKQGDTRIPDWEPLKPRGKGWYLVSISNVGMAKALWVRPVKAPAKVNCRSSDRMSRDRRLCA